MDDEDYYMLYLKYKNKYIKLKNNYEQMGGELFTVIFGFLTIITIMSPVVEELGWIKDFIFVLRNKPLNKLINIFNKIIDLSNDEIKDFITDLGNLNNVNGNNNIVKEYIIILNNGLINYKENYNKKLNNKLNNFNEYLFSDIEDIRNYLRDINTNINLDDSDKELFTIYEQQEQQQERDITDTTPVVNNNWWNIKKQNNITLLNKINDIKRKNQNILDEYNTIFIKLKNKIISDLSHCKDNNNLKKIILIYYLLKINNINKINKIKSIYFEFESFYKEIKNTHNEYKLKELNYNKYQVIMFNTFYIDNHRIIFR